MAYIVDKNTHNTPWDCGYAREVISRISHMYNMIWYPAQYFTAIGKFQINWYFVINTTKRLILPANQPIKTKTNTSKQFSPKFQKFLCKLLRMDFPGKYWRLHCLRYQWAIKIQIDWWPNALMECFDYKTASGALDDADYIHCKCRWNKKIESRKQLLGKSQNT